MFSQECFATIPPIPYRDSEIDVKKFNIVEDMDKVMFGRPHLLFKVKLRKYGGNEFDIFEIPLVYFSAFGRVQLETDDQMHQMGDIIQLYEPGPLPALEPILHVGFLAHVLCRVPLIPCYIGGSEHPTVPHRFARSSKVSNGRADRHNGTGDGSRLYEVNMWMWKFGRGMPRSRSVAETERIREACNSFAKSKGHTTRKRNHSSE